MAALLLLLGGAAQAQIFIQEDESNSRAAGDMTDLGVIPIHNVDYDQANEYAPLGEGMLLFATLGGAYLLGKRKKENK